MTGQVVQVEPTCLLLLISFKVGFVNGLFFLDLSEFFNLIMIDNKSLIIKGLIMQILFGRCSRIRSLVTNKSKRVSSLSFWFKSYFFNHTKWWEILFEVFFCPLSWEVLDVQIASLLWSFISDGIFLLFNFSFAFVHSMSYIEFWKILFFFSHLSIV